jgi:MoaA/NifB/PqqE/SkfB family radical SAM enzyme
MIQAVTHTLDDYGMRKGAEEFPLMVVLSFVYLCNARCPNCPYNNSAIRGQYKDALFMSEEIFVRIADECARFNSYLRLSGGGEPMLHPNAVALMLYAKRKGARIGLITNGSAFSEESLESLIAAGVDNLEFSVDAGDGETYRMVRPGLDWGRLNRNVRLAMALRNRLKSGTRIIASIISQQGVDVRAAERHWNRIVDKVQIRKFLTWGYNKDRSSDPTPYLPPEQRVPCPWLFERLNVDSRGDVTLCGEDIAFREKFANIIDRSIKDIWQGPEFADLRARHLRGEGHTIPICSQCPDWQYRSWKYNYWKVIEDAERQKRR